MGTAIRGTVIVQKVDTKANTITVRKPDGTSRTLPVESEEGRTFIKKLKKGDKVDVVYVEAAGRRSSASRPKGRYFSMR